MNSYFSLHPISTTNVNYFDCPIDCVLIACWICIHSECICLHTEAIEAKSVADAAAKAAKAEAAEKEAAAEKAIAKQHAIGNGNRQHMNIYIYT